MNHKISNTPIYYSTEYKKFKFLTGNRNLNETKIKRIIKDIDNGLNMLKYCPVVVNKDLVIFDGQHRFQVAKILKHPVYYVIADELTLHQIASVNSRTERWKPTDFVNCYVSTGNKQYQIVKQFIDDYKLPVSSALLILTNGISNNNYNQKQLKEFEEGKFVVKDQAGAKTIAEYAMRFDQFAANRTGNFFKALNYLFRAGKFDPEVLIKKYQDNPDALTSQGSHKAYLSKLEEIYNYRNQKRTAIY